MHLDRIEISGFKSFADKTTIVFDKGVTAVVGPNGSGKSNLSEAIKWVLGEQSAKSLRGKKMDDIIFAGSQSRKPTNIAEVTLVLNNEDRFLPLDFSEIQLTRRIHRNGDTECFINKKSCRLKDIVNLLMDSGLGKDSFSIISQGKVETIFQNKPEDRRGMFEEVAGVLKYKTRKQEATRKLIKTQEHLDRIEDILFEIQNQLGPLEKQKEKAKVYIEKRQQLRDIDIALMVAKIESSHAQLQTVQLELQTIQHAINEKETHNSETEKQVFSLRQQLTGVEALLLKLQETYVNAVQQVEKLVGQQKVIQERLMFSNQNQGQQESAKFEKEQQLNQLKSEFDTLRSSIKAIQLQVKQFGNEQTQLQQHIETLSSDQSQTIEDERNRYIAHLQNQAKLQNELLQSQKLIDQLTIRLEKTSQQLANEKIELQNIQKEKDAKRQSLLEIVGVIKTLTHKYEQIQQELDHQLKKKQAIDQKLQQVVQNEHQLKAKINSLKDLTEDYAGYYQGVRAILRQKQTIDGIYGSLAELIQVKEQYATAIDIALGASLQNVVVENETTAKRAIAYLKEQRQGRATFLPIAVIKGRQLPSDVIELIQSESGFVGVASDLITFDNKFTNIVTNALGQTIVSKTIDDATIIARKTQFRYRVVTLDGQVVHAGGSMTGGALAKTNSSLLTRQSDLKAFEKQLKEVRLHKEQLLNDSQQLNESLKQLREKEQQVQQDGTASRLKEKELALLLDQATVRENQLVKQVQLAESDYKQIALEIKENNDINKSVNASLIALNDSITYSRQVLAQLNASQDEKETQLVSLQEKLQSVMTKHAIAQEQLQTQQSQSHQLQTQMQSIEMALSALSIEQNESHQSREELTQQLVEIDEQLKLEIEKRDRYQRELVTQRELKNDLDVQIVLNDEQLATLQKAMQQLLREEGQLQGRLERYNVTIDTHLNRLSQEYELTFEAAKDSADLSIPLSQASQIVSQLKREIEQLGAVNLAAIEEFDAVSERYAFMQEQQSDLLLAKAQLQDTMLEMDQEVEKRFKETFYAIKLQFEKTFPKLFGGGRATLELSDPSNLLESGIEIIAQPPGKRLQNLSLLSGGERAFTAIALLFAILEVKPVPFCLLDEVEAALDEANVGRYGRYLKEFVDQTQFIVITHRKGTMEEADVLYGVTMQESGVSKLASVKLEEYA